MKAAAPRQPSAADPMVEYVRRSLDLDDPGEIERRAGAVAAIGYRRTANHMREQADLLRLEREAQRATTYRSPIPEASADAWTRFVRLMQTGETGVVTPSGQLGVFQVRLKRLEDLGIASQVRREDRQGKPEWTANVRAPLSLERLLADPLLQYRVFVASMRRYRDEILARHRDALGREIEGKPATLSGLLAVAHHAGPGLASWIADEADRRRFGRTTAAYDRTTGVF